MPAEYRSVDKDAHDSLMQQRFYGKIQYMRAEHGYIRSRSKIEGVRDITFNYYEMPRDIQRSLSVGDLVSFRVNFFSSGKFCAVDVKKEDFLPAPQTPNRSASPFSISSCDTSVDGGFSGSRRGSISYPLKEMEYSTEKKDVPPAFIVSSLPVFNVGLGSSDREDPLSIAVDAFIEKGISRNYNAACTSCWLDF